VSSHHLHDELHDSDHGYEHVAARFGLADDEPVQRRANRKQKKSQREILDTLAGSAAATDERFDTSYTPARSEAVWLRDSLRPFFTSGQVEDVLALVKGGKEANVYLCRAPAGSGMGLLAAKVYRPRALRNLRNDKMYREGRELLGPLGVVKQRDSSREMRAIAKKTDFGAELIHGSWLLHEYATLQRLHGMGAAVPEPLGVDENAILMRFVGDRTHAAPPLYAVTLGRDEAPRLFAEVMRNVELMLAHTMIHGDLSAYNILYWRGQVTLIDFPQVTFALTNSNAWRILRRDVERVCAYFATQGVESDPPALARAIWDKYIEIPREGQ
jgi:RIO kinase 1